MGDYADWEDVTNRYIKSGNFADSDEMQDSYIAGVEGYMNGFLAKQFTTPLSGKPPLLQDICVDLVYAKIAHNKDKGVPAIRASAIKALEQIVMGDILLTDTNGATIASLGGAVWSSTKIITTHFPNLDL